MKLLIQLVGEILHLSGKSQGISETSGCGNHEWVIPENIHTIPRAASWNSEGEGGFLGLEFRRRGGVTHFGIPKAWGGVSALNSVNFQTKDGESSA